MSTELEISFVKVLKLYDIVIHYTAVIHIQKQTRAHERHMVFCMF